MRIRLAVPPELTQDEQRAALDATLAAVTAAQEPLVRRGRIPTAARAIREGRVRWRAEPPGDEHFDLASTVLRRGWGDCDDLAPWHAASLRATGQDPGAVARVRPSGPGRWHAVVVRGDGSVDDPSEHAGMRSIVSGAPMGYPAVWAPMSWRGETPATAVAVRPWHGGYAARADLPMADYPYAVSGVCSHGDRGEATRGACRAALEVAGDGADAAGAVRLAAMHDALDGVPLDDVLRAVEQEGLDGVGFLPGLAAVAPAIPGMSSMLSSVPGLGTMFGGGGGRKSGGGGGRGGSLPAQGVATPGTTVHVPGGPIIVRF